MCSTKLDFFVILIQKSIFVFNFFSSILLVKWELLWPLIGFHFLCALLKVIFIYMNSYLFLFLIQYAHNVLVSIT